MVINVDEVLKWAPVFTAIVLPVVAWVGRRMLIGIHQLVNDRLDKALERIDDLEDIVKERGTTDPGSTAQSLRSRS